MGNLGFLPFGGCDCPYPETTKFCSCDIARVTCSTGTSPIVLRSPIPLALILTLTQGEVKPGEYAESIPQLAVWSTVQFWLTILSPQSCCWQLLLAALCAAVGTCLAVVAAAPATVHGAMACAVEAAAFAVGLPWTLCENTGAVVCQWASTGLGKVVVPELPTALPPRAPEEAAAKTAAAATTAFGRPAMRCRPAGVHRNSERGRASSSWKSAISCVQKPLSLEEQSNRRNGSKEGV